MRGFSEYDNKTTEEKMENNTKNIYISDYLSYLQLILITILTQDKIIVKMVITPETLLTN